MCRIEPQRLIAEPLHSLSARTSAEQRIDLVPRACEITAILCEFVHITLRSCYHIDIIDIRTATSHYRTCEMFHNDGYANTRHEQYQWLSMCDVHIHAQPCVVLWAEAWRMVLQPSMHAMYRLSNINSLDGKDPGEGWGWGKTAPPIYIRPIPLISRPFSQNLLHIGHA